MMETSVAELHPDVGYHFDLVQRVCGRERLSTPQTAYALAVARHHSLMGLWMEDPASGWTHEGSSKLGNVKEGDGPRFRARGYLPIVGRSSYAQIGDQLGLPLTDRPELAAWPEVAVEILVVGMKRGLFTGRHLARYVNETSVDYWRAQRVLPSLSKPIQVAAYARQFEAALEGAPPNGPTRSDIIRLQSCLAEIGWPVPVDGHFGPLTMRAVADFQAGYTFCRLPIDGTASPLTRLAIESCWSQGGYASDHFRFAEFRTPDHLALCVSNRAIRIERRLLHSLERYRALIGGPVRITSGYRSETYNRRIGARPDSEHLRGLAVHVEVPLLSATAVSDLKAFTSIGLRDGLAVHLGVGRGSISRPRIHSIDQDHRSAAGRWSSG